MMPVQGTQEWLDFRKTRIGASDAPIINGDSPWCNAYELWQRKLGLVPDQFVSPAMQRGKDLEPKAREEYIRLTGNTVMPAVVVHKEHEYIFASLDGLSPDGIVIEIKCANRVDHLKAIEGQVPDKYLAQLMHQLAVTEAEIIDYVSYCPDHETPLAIVKISRDENYINDLIEKEKEFYICMVNKVPPFQNAEVDRLIVSRKQLLEIEKDIKGLLEKNREAIIQKCGGESAVGPGYKVTKSTVKGHVDYSKIEILKDIDLEQYRKPDTIQWRITIGD